MRRWIGISLMLIFLLWILGGCGGSGNNYVGKWVSEGTYFTPTGPNPKHVILEIKKDSTWEWEIPPTFNFGTGGEWSVKKGKIELYVGKIKQYIPHLVYEMEIEKTKLIERRYGITFVKQD